MACLMVTTMDRPRDEPRGPQKVDWMVTKTGRQRDDPRGSMRADWMGM